MYEAFILWWFSGWVIYAAGVQMGLDKRRSWTKAFIMFPGFICLLWPIPLLGIIWCLYLNKKEKKNERS